MVVVVIIYCFIGLCYFRIVEAIIRDIWVDISRLIYKDERRKTYKTSW